MTLLANYTFDGTAADCTGNSPPIELRNTTFTNGTLCLNGIYEGGHADGFHAFARITGFSYESFAVASDFFAGDFSADNIYLAGSTVSSKSGSDILTQKYGPTGKLVWSTTYGKSGQYLDAGIAITVRSGYVYVGGSKYNKNLDLCTLKYRAGN